MSSFDRLYVVQRDGERLDRIAKKQLGSERDGTVESILKLNPGLAAKGWRLPLGTTIKLPPRPTPGPARPIIKRVWGDT